MSSPKPSILLLGSQMAQAGAQEVLLTQARWFHAQGYPVTAAFFYDRDGLAAGWQAAHPFPVISLDAWAQGLPLWRKAARLLAGFGRLWRLLRRQRFEIIETFTPDSDLAGLPLAWLTGVPVRVATHHGYIEGMGWLKMHLHGLLVNSGLAQRLVAVSEQVRALAVQQEGVQPARVQVIRNGIQPVAVPTPAGRARLRAELAVPPDGLLVFNAARFTSQKGYAHLLAAVPAVLAACPQTVFAFAGEGPLWAEMQTLAQELGISGQVRFLGVRRDVPDLLGAADVFVMSSLSEGLPMALLEAMSAGLPCVVTALEGIREVVQHGYNGWLVPPGDSDTLATALIEVLNDSELRARLGAAARGTLLENYTVDRMCREYEAVFLSLIPGARQ